MAKKPTANSEPDKDKLQELLATDGQTSESSSTGSGTGDSGTSGANSQAAQSATADAPQSGKKRGRPKGSRNRPRDGREEQSPILPPEVVKAVVRMPYDVAASQYGEHWRLSDEELDIMIPAHMELANRYLPDWLKEHAALYTCLAFHGMYLSVRMSLEMQLRKEAEKKKVKPPVETRESVAHGPSNDDVGETRFGQVIEASQTPS